MFTIAFDETSRKPLYEQLYRGIRTSIECGDITADEKLPSKRKLAAHLNISQFTVESAYSQLITEGYVRTVEKKGYYVCEDCLNREATGFTAVHHFSNCESRASSSAVFAPSLPVAYDLKTNTLDTTHFPYTVWSRLMRECMRDEPDNLVSPIHPQGDPGLRAEIAGFLREYRGMRVNPEQIVLGAGTEYLLGLITELLRNETFAIEDPSYHKFAKLLASRQVAFRPMPLDGEGLRLEGLRDEEASVALITPSHQFPLGIIMGIARRRQLLAWAATALNNYLIEDDVNSEFHFALKPIPSLYSLDTQGKVVYLNSFANTLTPSLRIAYMVLPKTLLERYAETLRFYSCTVSAFEQLTLKRFLRSGSFERHLNRMRTVYRKRQGALVEGLSPLQGQGRMEITGQQAGLHVLVRMPEYTEEQLVRTAAEKGVAVYPLSEYFYSWTEETHSVVAGFAGLKADALHEAAHLLVDAWR